LGRLRTLCIDKGPLTDADAKELGRLKRLEVLVVEDHSGNGSVLTEVGWRELTRLTELRRLSLPGNSITDAGLKRLGDLRIWPRATSRIS
ncbi:MAG: hypothetical protein LC749_16535, partial [Actinobacteria bacterium]|nr:hypothetical protein [Actinomycetota bacterium]